MLELHFGLRRHIGVGFWIGVGFLCLAALLYAKSESEEHARNWGPLDIPISLNQGIINTPTLGPDLRGDYAILIEFDRKTPFNRMDFDRMDCLLGTLTPQGTRPKWCNGIPDLIDISWTLIEGKNMVSSGDSSHYPGGELSDKIYRHVGRFQARKGHSYSVVLNVKKDASELDMAHPRLLIRVPQDESEGYGARIYLEQLGALILALIGGIIVLGRLFFLELRRRKRTET